LNVYGKKNKGEQVMMLEIERKQKILDEIMEEARMLNPKKQVDEFSVKDFCVDTGLGKESATEFLNEQVTQGILSVRATSKGKYYRVI
jgi:hypothetical protein